MDCLSRSADLYGYELEKFSGSETNLVQAIVGKVLEYLKSLYPVALDERAAELSSILLQNLSKGSCTLGIFGMGGIGKTTLAEAVFKRLKGEFAASCFLADVTREVSKGDQGLLTLQRQLLSDFSGNNEVIVEDVSNGKSLLRQSLQSKRTLIVMDGVESFFPIDALWPSDSLGVGSCCIITTRDVEICLMFSPNLVCEVEFLKPSEAKQLFCWHAFGSTFAAQGFEELASEVALACGGHPLTLEIIGKLLYRERNRSIWKEVLEHLQKHDTLQDHNKLLQRLKISYDSLEPRHKDMFLDVACFLLGTSMRLCKDIWASLGWSGELGLRNLFKKSLVKIDDEQRLTMHDLLIDLGHTIITSEAELNPGKRSRLWMPESEETLLNEEVTEKVETFSLAESKTCLSNQNLNVMEVLRLLNLDGCEGNQLKFPRLLRYIRWQRLPMEMLPCEMLHMRKLVVLDLTSSKLTRLWDPDSNVMFPKLQSLILDGCKDLKDIPTSISGSKQLHALYLEHCSSLENLPETIGQLTELVVLKLRGCTKLVHLPESIGGMSSLTHLDLTDCSNLVSLPETIGNCGVLSSLLLFRCCKLEGVPESVGRLRFLVRFESVLCNKITQFPDSMRDLHSLKVLKLSCSGTILPSFIEHLLGLHELCVHGPKLLELPSGICVLTRLQKLFLFECKFIESLPEDISAFKELTILNLAGCLSLKKLPDSLGELRNLRELNLLGCECLKNLPSTFGQLTGLCTLCLDGCYELVNLPDPSSISKLSRSCYITLYNFLLFRCEQNVRQGKCAKAEEDLSYLLSVKNDDPHLLEIQVFIEEAKQRKLKLVSMDVEMLRQEAHTKVLQNDMVQALEYIDRIVELEPHSELAFLTRAALRRLINDDKGMKEDIEKLSECTAARKLAGLTLPQDVLDRVDRYKILMLTDWKRSLLTLLDTGNNQEVKQLTLSADAQTESFPGKHALGRKNWKEVNDTQPEKAAALRLQASMKCFVLGDYYGALAHLEAARSHDPTNVLALSLLGRAKYFTGDYVGADAAYAQALAINPNHDDTLFHRGMLREAAYPFDLIGALSDYDKAIEANPYNCAVTYKARAKVKFKLGDFDGAAADLNLSYEMYPHPQTLQYKQGLEKWKEGKFEEALDDFEVPYHFLPNPCILRYKEGPESDGKMKDNMVT
ncbi:hypothetical protein KC19_4G177500 [Ceratodon purpureus]|nr:hypothetical protein KC19_4G177500 [Ceratodon purpureus]